MKQNKTKIVMWVLAILLVLAVGYIALNKIQESKSQKEYQLVGLGYEQGVSDCVNQVVQTVLNDIQTKGYTEVRFPAGNDTTKIVLVPYVPEQDEVITGEEE